MDVLVSCFGAGMAPGEEMVSFGSARKFAGTFFRGRRQETVGLERTLQWYRVPHKGGRLSVRMPVQGHPGCAVMSWFWPKGEA